jgi:hypothetical protein
MKNKLSVYCDMDQVIVALIPKIQEIVGKAVSFPLTAEEKQKVQESNEKNPLFEKLDKMPDANKLIKFIEVHFPKHALLTLDDGLVPNQAEQKRKWTKENLNDWKIIIVKGKGTNKAMYANPNSILIDDNKENITAWQKSGGIGILFHNASDAIEALENCLN